MIRSSGLVYDHARHGIPCFSRWYTARDIVFSSQNIVQIPDCLLTSSLWDTSWYGLLSYFSPFCYHLYLLSLLVFHIWKARQKTVSIARVTPTANIISGIILFATADFLQIILNTATSHPLCQQLSNRKIESHTVVTASFVLFYLVWKSLESLQCFFVYLIVLPYWYCVTS